MIVFADANLDDVIESVKLNLCVQAGQMCVQGSRLLVHDDIYDEFVDRATQAVKGIVVGLAPEMDTELGPLISEKQMLRVLSMVDEARQDGCVVLTGGKRADQPPLDKGFFVEPTLIAGATTSLRICQEEIFGPVLTIQRWNDVEQMIAEANDTRYGLAAGLWTTDLISAHSVARRMECGTVWINGYYNFKAGAPIGGYKASGFGSEGALETIKYAYSHSKSVIIKAGTSQH
ncbi:MAG: hypothetical protein DRR42_21310 [Gammaproteobacteria bacterium]|nr:MAG: hypothetical protein DRR42_21310 [Gammaproteobacteria bacterium]